MISLNRCTLIGRVGKDPDCKVSISNGKETTRATFSIATDHYTGKEDPQGKKIYATTWHNILCWNNSAKLVSNYLKKGHRVWVEGRVSTEEYTDKEGTQRLYTQIVVHRVGLIENQDNKDVTNEKVTDNSGLPF